MQKNTLEISSKAFWDVDFEKLIKEIDDYPEFVIKKVFEYGTFADVINVVKYFGKQKVIKTLTKAIYLHGKTLHFAAVFFKLEKNNFACFINKRQRHSYTKR